MMEAKSTMEQFLKLCAQVQIDYDIYRTIFRRNPLQMDLLQEIAPLCFGDLNHILIQHLLLQFCKITDPARMGKNANLTTNYILTEIDWPRKGHTKLNRINNRLMEFRRYVEVARSKRIAHYDLRMQTDQLESLGGFPEGEDRQFLLDLEGFVKIAYEHVCGMPVALSLAIPHDTYRVIGALLKSRLFDQCSKCTEAERATAFLDCQTDYW
jgi:hypothetical protein